MPFWSSQKLEEKQNKCGLIDKFDQARVKQGAYELSLSQRVLTTPNDSPGPERGDGEALGIPPGQFAMLLTTESVTIPSDAIAFISIKASKKLRGLINISGFHVDPGFSGRLKFSVYNAANLPIYLDYHKPTFLIWFADLDAETRDPYDGRHKYQDSFTSEERQVLSRPSHGPSALAERLDRLEQRVTTAIAIALFVLTVVLAPIIKTWLTGLLSQGQIENAKAPYSALVFCGPSRQPCITTFHERKIQVSREKPFYSLSPSSVSCPPWPLEYGEHL